MDEADARRLVGTARVARLATVSAAGRVDLVPITFALRTGPLGSGPATVSGDRLVTAVDHKPKTTTRLQRLADIRAHPEVTVLVDHFEEDWDALWWVRLRGRARVVERGPDHAAAMDALGAKYRQYDGRRPTGPAILVDVTRWQWWSGRPTPGF